MINTGQASRFVQNGTKRALRLAGKDYGLDPNFIHHRYFFVKKVLVRVNLLTHVWPQKQKFTLWHFPCVRQRDLCNGDESLQN